MMTTRISVLDHKRGLLLCMSMATRNAKPSSTPASLTREGHASSPPHDAGCLSTRASAQVGKNLLLLAVLFGLAGCFPVGMPPTPGWSPLYPVVIGARVDDGDLIVSTGRECPAGTFLDLEPVGRAGQFEATTLAALNRINITHPENDLSIRTYEYNANNWFGGMGLLRARAEMGDGSRSWGGQLQLPTTGLVDSSPQHPLDQYYWGEPFGWLTAAQVQARDGVDLLTICTPK